MGSYLSIVNNTNVDWYCKVGADEKVLAIARFVTISVGSIALIIGTAGAAAPAVAAWSGSVVTIAGVSSAALASLSSGAATTGITSLFASAMLLGLESSLAKERYVHIAPGKNHTWGKMSLSLWQQGTCTSTKIIDETHVEVKTAIMRPIFSGSTAGKTRYHDIQYWINKSGTVKHTIEADPTAKTPSRQQEASKNQLRDQN